MWGLYFHKGLLPLRKKKFSRLSLVVEGFSLVASAFTDDVTINLQLSLDPLATKCVKPLRSELTPPNPNPGPRHEKGVDELLNLVKEFKYLGALFMREEGMGQEIVRQLGAVWRNSRSTLLLSL